MKPRAFLCALGAMGQRHVTGLVRAGCDVVAYDPDPEAGQTAAAKLAQAGLSPDAFHRIDHIPTGRFDLAIFSETTRYRADNVAAFFSGATAERVLLEKPLATNLETIEQICGVVRRDGVRSVHVNFARRTWPVFRRLRSLCNGNRQITMTVNGGAVGLGCNGIHYLDLFEFLCPGHETHVALAQVGRTRVASGRGAGFSDFGGHFVLQRGDHRMLGSLSEESSCGATLTIRGDHVLAWIDAASCHEIRVRDAASTKPSYLYGQDFVVESSGKLTPPALDAVTERWVIEPDSLPALDEALGAHRTLLEILRLGGAEEPYRFT